MHHRDATRILEVEQVVAIGNGIHGVRNGMIETEQLGRHVAIERVRGASKRRGTQRVGIGGVEGSHEAREVASEHPEIREHMMAEQHGLGMLQMRVTRHDNVEVVAGLGVDHATQRTVLGKQLVEQVFRMQTRVGGNLVVTRAARMQARARNADVFDQRFLDGHMDVFVVDVELEAALGNLVLDLDQTHLDFVEVGLGDDALLAQHARMREGALDVLRIHRLIDLQRCAERLGKRPNALLKPAAPQSTHGIAFLVSNGRPRAAILLYKSAGPKARTNSNAFRTTLYSSVELQVLRFVALLLRPDCKRQRGKVDEALRGLMVERVGGGVARQTVIVERVVAHAAGHGAAALEQLHLHGAGDELLGFGEERVEGVLQRAEPLAVIHGGGPLMLEVELEVLRLTVEAQGLERLVGRDEHLGGRSFVALARLHTDETILDHVDAAAAMLASENIEVHDDLQEALLFAVERARNALLEADFDIFSLVGSILGIDGKGPDVRGRLVPGILERAAFDGAAPHVVVDGVRRSFGSLHRNAVLGSPVDFLFTGVKFPVANGSENLELRIEGLDGGFEANLVVALAGAAMGDVLRAVLVRGLDHVLGEQRTRKGGKQRVGVLVEAVGGKRLGEVLAGVFLTHVHGLGSDCAALERLVLDVLEVGLVLANVAANSDNVEVLFNLQPLQAARGVQTAGVCEYNFFFLSHCCAFLIPPPRRRQFQINVFSVRELCFDPDWMLRCTKAEPNRCGEATAGNKKPGRGRVLSCVQLYCDKK